MTHQGIGGYFELELPDYGGFLHDDGVLLNSGRNALEYVLRSLPDVKHLWIPYYTCEVVLEPIKKLGIAFSFYCINEKLEMREAIDLQLGDYLLYTNYFGIKDQYVQLLADKYGFRLIVDNAQAWYANPIPGISTIYSPRKYVGVPDGGVAYCPFGEGVERLEQDYSFGRCEHLLKRIDLGPTEGYQSFKKNSQSLIGQPIKRMSKLTERLLRSIDFDTVKKRRLASFSYLDDCLKEMNYFSIPDTTSFACPMVFPFLTKDATLRSQLIERKVYVATYWPNVAEWSGGTWQEKQLVSNLLPIPCDQRLCAEDMEMIVRYLCDDLY